MSDGNLDDSNDDASNIDASNIENAGANHFDEVDAVRRFPSEEEWLDLPLPESFGDQTDTPAGSSPAGSPAAESLGFVERVLQAKQDERKLDEQIADLDQALPRELLAQFAPPTPSDSFVAETTAKVQQDRRQRWQEMLSRYVAPEPSDAFVSRTLEALSTSGSGQASEARSANNNSTASGSGPTSPNAHIVAPDQPESVPWTRRNGPVFALVAAAAALLLWLGLSKPERPPLELRLAQLASPAVAWTGSPSPMGAILAQVAEDNEPFAMFDAPADGLWLTSSDATSSTATSSNATSSNGELR